MGRSRLFLTRKDDKLERRQLIEKIEAGFEPGSLLSPRTMEAVVSG
jgi:hypothetical protein